MPANVLRLPIAEAQRAAAPPRVERWRTIAEGYAPPAADDLVGRLDTLAEQFERLLSIAAAAGGASGTLPMSVAERPLISQAELAEILHSNPRSIREMEAAGKLPPSEKSGRKRLYDRAEVLRWIAAGRPTREQWARQGRK